MRKIKSILLVAFLSLITNQAFTQTENWQQEVDKYNSILEQERHIGIADTGRYLDALYELSILYYKAEKYNDVINISIEADSLCRKMFSVPTGLHISLLARLANAFFELKDYRGAASAQFAMISLEEYIFNNEGKTIDGFEVKAQNLVEDYRVFAAFTRLVPDLETMKKALLYACSFMENTNVVDSVELAWNIYGRLYAVYYDSDSLELALYYLGKEYSVNEKKYGKKSKPCSRVLHAMAGVYAQKGNKCKDSKDYYMALKQYNNCDSIYRSINEDTTELYYFNLLHISECLRDVGAYPRALSIVEYVEPEIVIRFGDTSALHISSLWNLSSLYYLISDYEKSTKCLQKLVDYYSHKSENDSSCAEAFHNMARIYEQMGIVDSAALFYYKSIDVLKKTFGDYSLKLLFPYNRLLMIYGSNKDAEIYDSIVDLCNQIYEKKANDPQIGEYRLMGTLTIADLASRNRWAEAEELWMDAILLAIENGDTYHKFYLDALVKYVYESFDNGHVPNHIMQEALIDNAIFQYAINYSQLSIKERDRLLNEPLNKSVRDLVFSMTNDTCDKVNLYKYILFCKQQTLKTDVEFSKAAFKSDNKIIRDYYSDAKKQKTEMESSDERLMRIRLSRQGSTDWMLVSYDSVRNNLDRNDVAVEYIRYNDYRDIAKNKMPTERYIALMARKDWPEPKMVALCTADELRNLVSRDVKDVYGGGYVSDEIMRLLFEPISVYANKCGHVYFSPDGVLYNLAIENLPIEGGKTLGQKYGLIRCSSSRNIASIDNVPLCASAVLYGGIDYGKKQLYNREIATRKGWRYLPGTLEEVSKIDKILSNHGVKTTTMSGKAGTERSFLNLSGNETSIIHVATHGFFFTDSSSKRVSYFERIKNNENALSLQPEEDNLSPMQRSGLMFAGGNNVWMTKDSKPGNDDGVLLASEVVDMNLFGTELLVLSACETGLGDMSSEGVMGLQRAFKLAGVKTIVMSLWEVDDYATALMMATFYKKLMAGKSKREAFLYAQKTVREKYQDPKYWAAFIMLD